MLALRGRTAGFLLSAGGTLVLAALLRLVTPSLQFNDGFGYLDGQSYGAMARSLRTGEHFEILSPYAYRVLPAAIVAWSGLEYRFGFLVLNILAFTAAAGALYGLLTHYGTRSRSALLLVAWWLLLPAGLRFAEYYPVLIDGVGMAMTTGLLWAVVSGAASAWVIVLALAVLVRENLLLLAPLPAFASQRRGAAFGQGRALLLAIPAIAAIFIVRLLPPISAANGPSTFDDAIRNGRWFLENADARSWRFLAAPVSTLGMLFVLPALHPRRSAAFLRRHPLWLYYVLVSLVVAPIGGGDFDRFAFFLSPALAVLTADSADLGGRTTWLLTALHVLATRSVIPVGADEASYRAFNVATMSLSALILLSVSTLGLAVLVFIIERGRGAYRPVVASPISPGS